MFRGEPREAVGLTTVVVSVLYSEASDWPNPSPYLSALGNFSIGGG